MMFARGAAIFAVLLVTAPQVSAAEVCIPGDEQWIKRLCYSDSAGPVGYDHRIFGATPEWTDVSFHAHGGATEVAVANWRLRFPTGFIEDTRPRFGDVDGDGRPEVIVVHTDGDKGARLVILTLDGKIFAATKPIGEYHRWLAPAGVADLDGDGIPEIGYVDRPHLRRELVLLRLTEGELQEVVRLPGLTNHRIGDTEIAGGVRSCRQGAEFVLASADWQRVMVVGADLIARDVAAIKDMKKVLACQ